MDAITEQGSSSGHQGNTENNYSGYSAECFCCSGNFPRPFSLSAGKFIKAAAISRVFVIISMVHFHVLLIVYYFFEILVDNFLRTVMKTKFFPEKI